MANTCIWTGVSGAQYTYFVHELPTAPFDPNQAGNYVFAKLANNFYSPIYIGEGDLHDRISADHHQAQCITEKGATHVHEHLNPLEANRKSEESDLLAAYPQTYVPTGCNIKTGG
jgi:hypothetical protein